MKLVQTHYFNGQRLDCYQNETNQDSLWATGEQIGRLLGYSNPQQGLRKITSYLRCNGRLEGDIVHQPFTVTKQGRTFRCTINFYSFECLLALCNRAHRKNARAVKDFLQGIVGNICDENICKAPKPSAAYLTCDEFIRHLLRNSRLSGEKRLSLAREYVQRQTGQDILNCLPKAQFTAKEIGAVIGASASTIGKLAKKHNIKAPLGGKNEFGEWVLIETVPNFLYNGRALTMFKDLLSRA